ncbi:Putative disease resistance TIR-NBS-LRR class protein [Prunus dulcis]|uniref:Disease resistance TIR-NBS-LRR class protein n=1 Tax=Prunus dulcis TaxID=3755 RepID=A0A4Y1RCI8_PRUDU|nr:Putative disease resistance TIR-NBS-LRR class protein [Prunus dulcis]
MRNKTVRAWGAQSGQYRAIAEPIRGVTKWYQEPLCRAVRRSRSRDVTIAYNRFTNLTGVLIKSQGQFQQLCRLPRLVYEPISSQGDQYEFELPVFGNGSFCSTANQTFLPQKLYFYLATIDLSKNNIVGDTRTKIGQLQLLYMFVLDSNNFSSVIPDQISNLKSLKVLKLSMNHLSGIMPSSLASLNFFIEFKASYNNLKRPIPTGTQLQSFNVSAFEGNPDFCGAPLPNKCGPSRCFDADNKNNKDVNNGLDQLMWFHIFTMLGFIVGFWGVWFCNY